jgi:hypothetical protein
MTALDAVADEKNWRTMKLYVNCEVQHIRVWIGDKNIQQQAKREITDRKEEDNE